MIIIVQQFTKNKVQSSIAFGTLWSVLFMIQSQLQIGNWKFGPWDEVYWAKVVSGRSISGPKYYWGQSIPRAEMCHRPKYAWGQSGLGAKLCMSQTLGILI